jgi:hypothetical protein
MFSSSASRSPAEHNREADDDRTVLGIVLRDRLRVVPGRDPAERLRHKPRLDRVRLRLKQRKWLLQTEDHVAAVYDRLDLKNQKGGTKEVEQTQLGSDETLVCAHSKSGWTPITTFLQYLDWPVKYYKDQIAQHL